MGDDFGLIEGILTLAAHEAEIGGHSQIMTAHLLMALSKLIEIKEIAGIEPIIILSREFDRLGIEAQSFRRGLRTIFKKSQKATPGHIIHRSSGCKAVFKKAEKLAEETGKALEPIHLLRAAILCLGEYESLTPEEKQTPRKQDDDIPDEL